MFPTCPVCSYPVRRRGRTVHVACTALVLHEDEQPGVEPAAECAADAGRRECCFCHSRNTQIVNGAPFCSEHTPGDERARVQARTFTQVPDKCPTCGEYLTPTITKSKIKCKCDEPMPPRPCKPGCAIPHAHLSEAAWQARLGRVPQQARYGN